MTLIYLDDDQDDLKLFELAAEPVKGIKQLYTTSSHVSFFELLREHVNETIVFLDINMPVKNGFSVLKEIREERAFDTVTVVMHSTSQDNVSVSISRELGANYYTGKPDTVPKLQGVIRRVMARTGCPADPSEFFIPS